MSTATRIDRLEKNYLINGAMDFNQRYGTTLTNMSSSVAYFTDRWLSRFSGTFTGTPTTQQELISPINTAQYSLNMRGNASTAGSLYEMRQRIEAVNAKELVDAGTLSVSGWFFSNSATTINMRIFYANSADNFASVTEFTPVGGGQTITLGTYTLFKWENITVPAGAVNGIELRFEFNNMSVTGSAQTHRATAIMLNAGTKAATFTRNGRTIGDELLACARYCQVNAGGTTASIGFGHNQSANTFRVTFPLSAPLRASPNSMSFIGSFEALPGSISISGFPGSGSIVYVPTSNTMTFDCTATGMAAGIYMFVTVGAATVFIDSEL